MRFVNRLSLLATALALIAAAACERVENDPAFADAGPVSEESARLDRNVGEGERERSDQDISDEYRSEIDGDADLANAAGDTRLVAEHDGDLVLKGSVPTLELKHALETYATLLAERPVKNELEEKQDLPRLDGSVRPRE